MLKEGLRMLHQLQMLDLKAEQRLKDTTSRVISPYPTTKVIKPIKKSRPCKLWSQAHLRRMRTTLCHLLLLRQLDEKDRLLQAWLLRHVLMQKLCIWRQLMDIDTVLRMSKLANKLRI